MGIKPWHKPSNQYVEYSVGQPMGAYASWATLAITHHMLLRYLAFQLGIRPEYVVLGDDVVIADERLASEYVEVMASQGVSISLDKSVLPINNISKEDYSAEFAKQTLLNGHDLTPISPNILEEIFVFHFWWKFLEIFR
jgi:hypothetical protein